MSSILRLISGGSTALTVSSALHLILLGVCFFASIFDDRQVMGLNPWIKPMKFCLSIALYSATLSILLGLIDGYESLRLWIGRLVAAMMYIEITCITIQAVRGVTSHYNIATSFDGAIFGLMGIAIALNTILDAFVFGLFVISPVSALPTGLSWGIRFGLILFIGASIEGGLMIMNQAHTVGAPDGGPGLPWVNWSTSHGDLRIAHFLGLHAIQILPLLGLAVDWLVGISVVRAALVTLCAAGYGWVMWWQTKLALSGQPFLKG